MLNKWSVPGSISWQPSDLSNTIESLDKSSVGKDLELNKKKF